ncbi:hypothetical protein NDU88_002062 [Pleurodeles waltl]|uniref:Uncharacterized protein n=1 Tax=Pleurodeles waltl TaxID=8319 RepID=A0AAV7TK41_PLEWA|nr:hypothetical protein NDU88_002062 [Pleurodeles waltl]
MLLTVDGQHKEFEEPDNLDQFLSSLPGADMDVSRPDSDSVSQSIWALETTQRDSPSDDTSESQSWILCSNGGRKRRLEKELILLREALISLARPSNFDCSRPFDSLRFT